MVTHAYSSSSGKRNTVRSEVDGYPQLCGELKVNLEYTKACLKSTLEKEPFLVWKTYGHMRRVPGWCLKIYLICSVLLRGGHAQLAIILHQLG